MLGFAAALFGLGFTFGEDVAKRAFTRLALWPPLKVAIGGLGVGLVALVVPEVIGTGDNLPPIAGFRGPIQAMLDGRIDAGYAAVGFLLRRVQTRRRASGSDGHCRLRDRASRAWVDSQGRPSCVVSISSDVDVAIWGWMLR